MSCPPESPLVQLQNQGQDLSFMAKDGQGGSEKIEISMIPKNDRDFIENDFKVISSEKI